jgi:cyclopropane-fatty-acyl-phospholipid synthase
VNYWSSRHHSTAFPSDPQIKHPDFFKRVLQEGSLGLGESYMDGWWDCERLDIFSSVLRRAGEQLPQSERYPAYRVCPVFNLQSKNGHGSKSITTWVMTPSRMLDPYMQYLPTGKRPPRLRMRSRQTASDLREIATAGCAWISAAAGVVILYGEKTTVSAWWCDHLCGTAENGAGACHDLDVNILLQDYRELNDQFDRIVCRMEHVGPKNYNTYFSVADRNLKPDGIFLLHTLVRKD